MQYISYLVQRFHTTEFQRFTARLSGALLILVTIKKGDKSKDIEKDYDKLLWIGENTHEDIKVALTKLDMVVAESDNFDKGFRKYRFFKNGEVDDSGMLKQITLTEDVIQYYLCKAGFEIDRIVAENVKPYSDEFKLQEFGEEDTAKKKGGFDGI
jgi:hypothetical protein